MNKICTNIKQSKKLVELGIDINTADMHYMYRHWEIDENTVGAQSDANIGFDLDFYHGADNDKTYHYIPAWSLTALMNLLPSEFTTENEFGKYIYEIKIRKYNLIEDVNLHQIAYGSYKWHEDGGYTWKDMINTGEKEDFLDACYEMIIWLLENKKYETT